MARDRRGLALATLTAPVLLITLDMTVLGAALPAISEDLRPGAATQLWIVDIYSFVLAGLLVVAGGLGDRLGRRRLLLVGAAGVRARLGRRGVRAHRRGARRRPGGARDRRRDADALDALPDQDDLPGGELPAVVRSGSGRRRSPRAPRPGPVVGGWLLEHFWWGSVFLVNVPICLALLVVGPLLLPESRDPRPGRFDLASAGLALTTMLPVVYAVKSLATDGVTTAGVVAGAVGLGAGVVVRAPAAHGRRPAARPDALLAPGVLGVGGDEPAQRVRARRAAGARAAVPAAGGRHVAAGGRAVAGPRDARPAWPARSWPPGWPVAPRSGGSSAAPSPWRRWASGR